MFMIKRVLNVSWRDPLFVERPTVNNGTVVEWETYILNEIRDTVLPPVVYR